MHRIVPAITSLQQHLDTLEREPVVYRPPACPHCGLSGLWNHGGYARKADRGPFATGALNPIPIPRYFCQGCGHTCSRLPACMAPRRWYGWAIQQLVLQRLLVGCSTHRCTGWVGLDRRTIGRWWGWLSERSEGFALFLKARFPELGRAVDGCEFWQGCWQTMSLSQARAWPSHERLILAGRRTRLFALRRPPHPVCPGSVRRIFGFHSGSFSRFGVCHERT